MFFTIDLKISKKKLLSLQTQNESACRNLSKSNIIAKKAEVINNARLAAHTSWSSQSGRDFHVSIDEMAFVILKKNFLYVRYFMLIAAFT